MDDEYESSAATSAADDALTAPLSRKRTKAMPTAQEAEEAAGLEVRMSPPSERPVYGSASDRNRRRACFRLLHLQ
jgi:hypothetical protein